MNKLNELKTKLDRTNHLLTSHPNWAKAISTCALSIDEMPVETARKILMMYGGMGSFNDLVLYKGNLLLVVENIELDRLRQEIHQLCVELIGK